MIGRLKPGVEVEQAAEEIAAIADRLPLGAEGWSGTAVSMHMELTERAEATLKTLFGAVALVLIIACANVANLLLARSSSRTQEMSLRSAVGASSGRLFRQVLVESVLLSSAGALAGIGIAVAGLRVVRAAAGTALPRMNEVTISGEVLGFTVAVAVLTGLVFGILPAYRSRRVSPAEALKESAAGAGQSRQRTRVRSALVVVEVALAVAVIAAAGLLTRSLVGLQSVDPGFETEQRVAARVSLPEASYPDRPTRIAFFDEVVDTIRAHPTVLSADVAMSVPLTDDFSVSFDIVGQETPEGEPQPSAQIRVVGPDYFRSVSIPVLQGRVFDRTDQADAEHVVIVNEALVERFFPDRDPLGATLDIGFGVGEEDDPSVRRIVGVVGNTKTFELDEVDMPMYYLTRHQMAQDRLSLIVHAETDAERTLALVRDTIHAADPNLPIYDAVTLDEVVRDTTATERLRLGLISSFALLAVFLSGIGIYGMQSFGVAQRRREIGLRLAIGAAPRDVLGMVLRGGVGLALLGVALGTVGALFLGRSLAHQLFGISPYDPVTLAAVSMSVLAIAAMACWVPARRATRVDPASTLRAD